MENQLIKKKLPHIKKLIDKYKDKIELDLWHEIFISASEDNIESKYKYVKAIIDDLVKDNIYTLIEYKKRADQRKSTNIPNKSIPQNKKKDTNKKDEIKVLDNKFNNGSNQTFTKYTPEELEKLLQENQKRKFN